MNRMMIRAFRGAVRRGDTIMKGSDHPTEPRRYGPGSYSRQTGYAWAAGSGFRVVRLSQYHYRVRRRVPGCCVPHRPLILRQAQDERTTLLQDDNRKALVVTLLSLRVGCAHAFDGADAFGLICQRPPILFRRMGSEPPARAVAHFKGPPVAGHYRLHRWVELLLRRFEEPARIEVAQPRGNAGTTPAIRKRSFHQVFLGASDEESR